MYLIAKQPNNLYAAYCSIVETFIFINMEEDYKNKEFSTAKEVNWEEVVNSLTNLNRTPEEHERLIQFATEPPIFFNAEV